jgi:hypothetical protein
MRGIPSHRKSTFGNSESRYYRTGEDDTLGYTLKNKKGMKVGDNPEEFAKLVKSKSNKLAVKDDETVFGSAKAQIIAQVAAVFAMDVDATWEFINSYVFTGKEEGKTTREEVEETIRANIDFIIKSQDAISIHLNRKFKFISPLEQARIINEGIRLVNNSMVLLNKGIESAGNDGTGSEDMDFKSIEGMIRSLNTSSRTYSQFLERLDKWRLDVQGIVLSATKEIRRPVPMSGGSKNGSGNVENGENETSFLTAKSISLAAKKCGVDPVTADRIASLVIYGEQVQHHEMLGAFERGEEEEEEERDEAEETEEE